MDRDPAFVRRVATDRLPSYGWASSTAGRVRYATVPVRVAGDRKLGDLVIVEFYDREAQEIDTAVRVLALVGAAALVVLAAVGWIVAGRALAPVRTLRQAAERVDGEALTERIGTHGNDDLAQLGRTFNRMLDRLAQAFATQRRFLDDAGHELRTPITVIRGHLQVMGDDPEERAQTMALVDDELARMNRLVDDLLVLARSERPDFVGPVEVELADLCMQVIAKSRALGSRRWQIDELAERTVLGDSQRLTQALLQLTFNAVAHTRDADVIAVGTAVRGGPGADVGSGLRPRAATRRPGPAVRAVRPRHGSATHRWCRARPGHRRRDCPRPRRQRSGDRRGRRRGALRARSAAA